MKASWERKHMHQYGECKSRYTDLKNGLWECTWKECMVCGKVLKHTIMHIKIK